MKKPTTKRNFGLNFKKIVKTLSNNALKYLITIAYQEASYRNLRVSTPNLALDLPLLNINNTDSIAIRDRDWYIVEYTLDGENWNKLNEDENIILDLDQEDWYSKYKSKTPVSLKLVSNDEFNDIKYIEFHSRSKIFWFDKILNQ